jgi:high-affinity K+ transport system ATPase subunit B
MAVYLKCKLVNKKRGYFFALNPDNILHNPAMKVTSDINTLMMRMKAAKGVVSPGSNNTKRIVVTSIIKMLNRKVVFNRFITVALAVNEGKV